MRARRLTPYLLVLPAALFTALLTVVPLWTMLRMSLYARTSLRVFDPGTLTLDHYLAFFGSRHLPETAGRTVGYALAVTLLSLVLAYPVAYHLARTRSRWRPAVLAIVVMPYMVSLVVSAYGWLLLLGLQGPVNWLLVRLALVAEPVRIANTPLGGLIAMTVNFIPYQVLPLMAALTAVDRDLEEASASLGANPIQTFRMIVLPLSLPGMLAGCALVLILGLTAFVAPRMVGGPRMTMLGVEIYDNMTTYLNWPRAAAVGVLLTLITGFLYWALSALLRARHLELERQAR
ncbi:MAG: ABC transporter permease [Candidatus Rokubacteria bacterium]|nr:ABC transporter permease [Candidatus Rokubacteria bacterium]